MRRREFIRLVGGALVPFAAPALAQTVGRVYRLGHISNSSTSEARTRETVLPELAKLGFVEGQNLVFDGRVGDGNALPAQMGDLLAARPDVVVAVGAVAAKVASAATRTVPIITFGPDLIELGLAQSYARPGANITGVVILGGELEIKRLSILHETVPNLRRIAVLVPSAGSMVSEEKMRLSATGLGAELHFFAVATVAEYPAAFAAMRAKDVQALIIGATPEFYRDGKQLAELALDARLPTVCEWAEMANDGCLIGYGPVRNVLRRRMADQIAQILRGAAPGSIAVELPTQFEFAINQKVAKALDVSISVGVLARADNIIE